VLANLDRGALADLADALECALTWLTPGVLSDLADTPECRALPGGDPSVGVARVRRVEEDASARGPATLETFPVYVWDHSLISLTSRARLGAS